MFVAFAGNGKSVYDAWRTPGAITEPIEQWKQTGKKNHLRDKIIDKWSEIQPLKVINNDQRSTINKYMIDSIAIKVFFSYLMIGYIMHIIYIVCIILYSFEYSA